MDSVAESKENYYSGYVKIYRSLQKKGWYQNSGAVHLWVHLIMEATHTDREYWWNGKTITLKAGQFVSTRNKLASDTGLSRSFVDRWLKTFEIEQQVSQQMSNTSRLISILYYCDYQVIEPPMSHGRATGEPRVSLKQELDTLKELKKMTLTEQMVAFDYSGHEEVKEQAMQLAEIVEKNFKTLQKMKEPLTPEEVCKLVRKGGNVVNILRDMDNWKPLLTKNNSAYKTALKWLEKNV